MKVTIFVSVRETTSGRTLDIEQAFARIRNNKHQHDKIQAIRDCNDKTVRDELKKSLPCICWSGIFSRKNDQSCTKHSGLICLDFDNETRENIMAKPEYVFALFRSPSGTGYKVLVRIPESIDDHSKYFDSLKHYFGLPTFDPKVRNISAGCFDTEDPDLYVNYDAPVYMDKIEREVKRTDEVAPELREENPDEIIGRLQKWIDNKESFTPGNRNNYLHIFACALNRYGISRHTAIRYLSRFECEDVSLREIEDTTKGAYMRNSSEHATEAFESNERIYVARELIKQNKPIEEIRDEIAVKYNVNGEYTNRIIERAKNESPEHMFWTVIRHKDKAPYIKIDNEAIKNWYASRGIYRYWIDSKSWMMIKEEDFKVTEISEDHIRNEVNCYFDDLPEKIEDIPKSRILKAIQDQMDDGYLHRNKLAWLPAREIEWQEDTRDTAYFFYRNKAVKITKNKKQLLDYATELSGCIWSDQIIDRDIELLDNEDVSNGEFATFIKRLASGAGFNQDNWLSLMRTIGYILHSFKDPANPKSIILTDEVISENPEGGIGKGIFIKGIGQIKKSIVFDGKNWNWNKSFLFQRLNLSTQIMVFEDVNKNFNFEKLFSIVTEGVEVEKKNKESFYLPFPKSPKVLITSNYAIKGTGASHDRRRHEIELKKFFGPDFTPRDYFGHNLYDEWNKRQWQLFDNFMMACVEEYLNSGLTKPPAVNMSYKKLINEVPEEFISWMDTNIPIGIETLLNEAAERFREVFGDFKKVQNRDIMRWIAKAAEHKGLKTNKYVNKSGTVFILVKMGEDGEDTDLSSSPF